MEEETYAIEDARLAHYQNASSAYYVVYRMRLQNISLLVTSHRVARSRDPDKIDKGDDRSLRGQQLVNFSNTTPLATCLSMTGECRCAVNFNCQRTRFNTPMFLDAPWHNPCGATR